MKCPKCEQTDSRVLKTYFMVEGKVNFGEVKARLRQCRVCDHQYYAYEVHEDMFMRLNLTESRPLRRQPLKGRASSSSKDSKRLVEQLEKRLKSKAPAKKKKRKP